MVGVSKAKVRYWPGLWGSTLPPSCGAQHERGDHRALADLLVDHEGAPAAPAAGFRLSISWRIGLATLQDVGQEPVGFAPGVEDLVGGASPSTSLIAPSRAVAT
jgi:hypothetical protein